MEKFEGNSIVCTIIQPDAQEKIRKAGWGEKKNEKSRFEKCEKGSGKGSRVRKGIKWWKRALSGEKWL